MILAVLMCEGPKPPMMIMMIVTMVMIFLQAPLALKNGSMVDGVDLPGFQLCTPQRGHKTTTGDSQTETQQSDSQSSSQISPVPSAPMLSLPAPPSGQSSASIQFASPLSSLPASPSAQPALQDAAETPTQHADHAHPVTSAVEQPVVPQTDDGQSKKRSLDDMLSSVFTQFDCDKTARRRVTRGKDTNDDDDDGNGECVRKRPAGNILKRPASQGEPTECKLGWTKQVKTCNGQKGSTRKYLVFTSPENESFFSYVTAEAAFYRKNPKLEFPF